MTVETIKEAIQHRPDEERTSPVAWLQEMEYDEWDKQMVKDFSPGGRGIQWGEAAKHEDTEDTAGPIQDGFAQRRRKRS